MVNALLGAGMGIFTLIFLPGKTHRADFPFDQMRFLRRAGRVVRTLRGL
jgi:hypothetical protein